MSEKEKVEHILRQTGFTQKFDYVNTMTVWSDGKKIRRYQGQDKNNYNSNNGKNRKMLAILVEIQE